MSDKLSTSFYAVLHYNPDSWQKPLTCDRIVKTIDTLPRCAKNQVPILITVRLPKALFQRPELAIEIDVDQDVPRIDIDADVQNEIAERISELVGVGVHLSVELPEDIP